MADTNGCALPNDAYCQLLQMQIEQLEAELTKLSALHKNANYRANNAESRNKRYKTHISRMEGDFRIIAQCWSCDALGDRESCKKCANSAVFVWNGTAYEWRGDTLG